MEVTYFRKDHNGASNNARGKGREEGGPRRGDGEVVYYDRGMHYGGEVIP